MLAEEIEKAWAARAKNAPFYPTPTFVGDALMLGAGTEIARAAPKFDGGAPASEARVFALLAATFLRPIGERPMAHFRHALRKRADGDDLTASVHLAMMGLPRLIYRESAARRLFAADRLLSAGIPPETISEALNFSAAQFTGSIKKYNYNPEQPRVPAGNGWLSGEWTKEQFSTGEAAGRPGLSPRTRVELERPKLNRRVTRRVYPDAYISRLTLRPIEKVKTPINRRMGRKILFKRSQYRVSMFHSGITEQIRTTDTTSEFRRQ